MPRDAFATVNDAFSFDVLFANRQKRLRLLGIVKMVVILRTK